MATRNPPIGKQAIACTLAMVGLAFFVSVNEVQAARRGIASGPSLLAQAGCAQAPADPNRPLFRPYNRLCLLQPLNATDGNAGTTSIDMTQQQNSGIGVFFTYFNLAWPWLIGVAAGFAVLQAIVGGIQIMISGGSEQKSAGQMRLTWALAGLLLVVLAAAILRILNPLFYR